MEISAPQQRIIKKKKMTRNASRTGIFLLVALSILSLVSLAVDQVGIACCVSSVFVSICLCIKHSKSTPLFIVLLLISFCNYSFIFRNYISPSTVLDYSFDPAGGLRLLSARIILLYTYLVYVFLFIFTRKRRTAVIQQLNPNTSRLITIFLLIALLLIWFLFYDFSFGRKAGYYPIYEYSTILFIFAFFYSGKNKGLRMATVFLAVFYVVFDFLGGQRSTGVQISIIAALSLFAHKIKARHIIVLGFLALVGLNFISVFRGAGSFSITNVSLFNIIQEMFSSGFSSDTASFSYYSSTVYLFARTHFTTSELLGQFSDYLSSQLVIGSVGESITEIALHFHHHYYGGVLPIYLYYYLGYLGVFLIALLTSWYFSIIASFNCRSMGLKYVFSIYIVATSFRWYLYSPNQLLRGTLLLLLLYLVFRVISSIFRAKVSR